MKFSFQTMQAHTKLTLHLFSKKKDTIYQCYVIAQTNYKLLWEVKLVRGLLARPNPDRPCSVRILDYNVQAHHIY